MTAGSHIFGVNAFATIQAGVNAVAAGGTVNVAAGIYAENVSIGQSLTLNGSGPGTTVINPSSGAAISVSGASTIVLQHFSMTGGAGTSSLADSGVTSLTLADLASSTAVGGTLTGTTGTVNITGAAMATISADGLAQTFGTNTLAVSKLRGEHAHEPQPGNVR